MTKKRFKGHGCRLPKVWPRAITAEIADDLKDLGFYYATMSGLKYGHERLRTD